MKELTNKPKAIPKRSIIREKVWIDTKMVNTSCKHLLNKVVQCVFKSDADPSVVPEGFAKEHSKRMVTYVCFSGLSGQIMNARANRMYTKLEVAKPQEKNQASKIVLTSEERSSWLALAKEYKLLPPYINEDAIEDIPEKDQREVSDGNVTRSTTIASGEFIIDLKGLSPAMLYIYLSTIRNIREDPGLPRSVTYLVNEIGMNFFAAYVFSSMVVLNSTGHHILSAYRPYGLCKETYQADLGTYTSKALNLRTLEKSIRTPINQAIGLQRMVNSGPRKYDRRDLLKMGYSFNCNTTIGKISKVRHLASFQELFDEDIIAAIMSENDREAEECIKKFIEKKPRIKYKSKGAKK
jgi:hypothetical protein